MQTYKEFINENKDVKQAMQGNIEWEKRKDGNTKYFISNEWPEAALVYKNEKLFRNNEPFYELFLSLKIKTSLTKKSKETVLFEYSGADENKKKEFSELVYKITDYRI